MVQNVALDVKNNRFPCEGPKVVKQILDFSISPNYSIDLNNMVETAKISEIQSAFIDNADSNYPIIITCDITSQRVIIPPNSQAYVALLNLSPSFIVQSSYLGKITIHFLNIPCTNVVWGANASGGATTNVNVMNYPLLVNALDPFPISTPGGSSINTRNAYLPVNASGKQISVTSASSNTVIVASNLLKIINTGPDIAFIRMGTVAQTALITDYPILVNESVTLVSNSATNIGAITAGAGTATLQVASVN